MTGTDVARLSNLLFLIGIVGCSDDGIPAGGTEGDSAGGVTSNGADEGGPATQTASTTAGATATASNSGGTATTGPDSDSDSAASEGSTSAPEGSSTGNGDGPDFTTSSGSTTGTTTGTGTTETGTDSSSSTTGTSLIEELCPEYGEVWEYCGGEDPDEYADWCETALEYFEGEDCYTLLAEMMMCISDLDCLDWASMDIECAEEIEAAEPCAIG